MPVAILVIVPTSRGVELRREGFPHLAHSSKRAVENILQGLGFHVHLAFVRP